MERKVKNNEKSNEKIKIRYFKGLHTPINRLNTMRAMYGTKTDKRGVQMIRYSGQHLEIK